MDQKQTRPDWYFGIFLATTLAAFLASVIAGYRLLTRHEFYPYGLLGDTLLGLGASILLRSMERKLPEQEPQWQRRPSSWFVAFSILLLCLFWFFLVTRTTVIIQAQRHV